MNEHMNDDTHKVFQHWIDQQLAGDLPARKEEDLGAHLATCAACQEYRNLNRRTIASLHGFSFEVDPALRARVSAALALRSQQLHAQPSRAQPLRRRLAWAAGLALLFSIAGSFIDLRLSSIVATVFGLQLALVRQEVFSFWILPSLLLLAMFPLLPLLTQGSARGKEKAL